MRTSNVGKVLAIAICLMWSVSAFADETKKDEGKKAAAKPAARGPRTVGQRPQGVKPPGPVHAKQDITRDEAPPAPAGAKQLSFDEVFQMLDDLGYEPKKGSNDNSQWIDMKIERGTWTFAFSVSLSGDNSNIWVDAFLGRVEDPEQVPVIAPLKLLEANNNVWPAYFAYYVENQNLWIYRPIPNTNLTRSSVRKTLDGYMTTIESTVDLWDTSKWSAAPAPPSAN